MAEASRLEGRKFAVLGALEVPSRASAPPCPKSVATEVFIIVTFTNSTVIL